MTRSQQLRTPRAAGVAGILFALLLAMALLFLRSAGPSGSEVADRRASLALSLVPFAGITFLWFVGVVRDRIGQREDRFLATVCLGSGLLFVAMLFVASGVAIATLAPSCAARTGASPEGCTLGRSIAAILMNTYAMRMAAIFMFSTSAIGLRTGFVPRWLTFFGFTIGVVLLLGIKLTLWVQLLFPLWVFVLSVDILVETFRERPGQEHAEGRSWERSEQGRSA